MKDSKKDIQMNRKWMEIEKDMGGAAGEVQSTSLTGEFHSPELLKRRDFKN